MKPLTYKAQDYTWLLRKDTEPNPNTGKYDLVLKIVEFDVEYFFETAEEAMHEVESIIEALMETRIKKQKMALPIPLKFEKKFSGKLTVRLTSETHRKIYLEALQTDKSLNQIIEHKLASI